MIHDFKSTDAPEKADEERRGAGGGASREGGAGLVVEVLRFHGGAGEAGETANDQHENLR